MDKRGLIDEIFKLVSELRADGLKRSLSPSESPAESPDAAEPEMPGAPDETASGMPPGGSEPDGDEPDPAALQKLLELMGGE